MEGFQINCNKCDESLEINKRKGLKDLKNKLSLDLNLDEEDIAYSSIELNCSNCGNFVRLEYE